MQLIMLSKCYRFPLSDNEIGLLDLSLGWGNGIGFHTNFKLNL